MRWKFYLIAAKKILNLKTNNTSYFNCLILVINWACGNLTTVRASN